MGGLHIPSLLLATSRDDDGVRAAVSAALWFVLGSALTLLAVRLATIQRDHKSAFRGPTILWAIPSTLLLGAVLFVLGMWAGQRLAIRQARLEAVEPLIGRVGERLDSLNIQRGLMDSTTSVPRGCPLATGC